MLLHSVAEWDISAQKTCHILLGTPLYHSSRQFVVLNLSNEIPRWICGTRESEKSPDSGRTEKSPLTCQNRWKECQKENIVRIFSRPSPLREGPQWEDFCQINTDPIDLLGQPIGNAENKIVVEEEEQLIEDNEEDEFRDIDTFISSDFRISTEEENLTVDYQTLNDNQKKVFNRIKSHYYDVLVEHQVEPLRIIVMGTARTRKTYLIEAIRGRLQEMAGTGSKLPIVVLTPTGVAAFNINGE
ncbi:ATP-dependent DNA helicase PIF1-like [Rhizophagus irregularis DAOM 181602=DAOM 197198]|nr:ATP-dependent DNA helicase PIF1-like [Rhizophagus irregularis DAOM 181602=DAOM 197198]